MKQRPATRICRPFGPRRRGVALVTVLTLLALVTVLVVSFLSLARIEYVSANRYADNIRARSLSEAATSIVIDQIWRGTAGSGPSGRAASPSSETWISQPGALRRYGQGGSFTTGYKLYSDAAMVVESEEDLVDDAPPENWNTQPLHYVDLNEPVLRSGPIEKKIYFPIADPRAFYDDPETDLDDRVEGFSYTDQPEGGQSPIAGVITPGNAEEPIELRLPMPVQWLYVLRDGTFGYLGEDNRFTPGDLLSADNPIVGRVAFWTDDESAKLNINTASEATAWLPPSVYHKLSARFARSQPYAFEFQRYPGHPATTSLSPVLFPNATLNYLDVYDDPGLAREARLVKNRIYNIIPKMLAGGSNAGNRNITPFTGLSQEDLDLLGGSPGGGPSADERRATREKRSGRRLYASLDELMLRPNRLPNNFPSVDEDDNELEITTVTPEVIERGKFFLTANSRAPETNIFSLPRISMWPLHEETRDEGAKTDQGKDVEFRTAFDQLIGFCSTVNTSPYYFTRRNADDSTEDIELERNKELLGYLDVLTSTPVPGWGGSFASPAKYGSKNEREQILTEIFDYTRSLNLHDDTLPDSVRRHKTRPAARPPVPAEGTFGPFTNPRYTRIVAARNDLDEANELNAFPGHGQVTPSYVQSDDTMGFGRFYTVSEVALHFIASADAGTGPSYSAGGRGISNIPPVSKAKLLQIKEAIKANDRSLVPPEFRYLDFPESLKLTIPKSTGKTDVKFAETWNYCLPHDRALASGKKLIQAALLLEFFCPAAGWTQIANDFHVRISGLGNLNLNGSKIFPDAEVEIPSNRALGNYNGGSNRGGPVGFRGFLTGRSVADRAPLDNSGLRRDERRSAGASNSPWDGNNARPGHAASWPLVSEFIEVDRNAPMNLSVDGPIVIEIHAGSKKVSGRFVDNLVQTIEIQFAGAPSLPPPLIVTDHEKNHKPDKQSEDGLTAKEAFGNVARWKQHWWTFHRQGCAGAVLKNTRLIQTVTDENNQSKTVKTWPPNDDGSPGIPSYDLKVVPGRFNNVHNAAVKATNIPSGGNFIHSGDVVQSMIPRHGDYRLIAARRHVPLEVEGKAVFVPHRRYGSQRMAHNLVNDENTRQGFGFDYGDGDGPVNGSGDTSSPRLVEGAPYNRSRWPDFPSTAEAASAAQKYNDFDNGISNLHDGPYINKPDDGNNYVQKYGAVPYLDSHDFAESTGSTFFSPNRQVPSPGVFGSLSTGVKRDIPWRTLLFRPPVLSSGNSHPGAESPPDHLFMDLFWMPIVEPYAISEPLSTAGKVNLNYQLLPFRHITRATALHGVMKGEIMRCIPTEAGPRYLNASDTNGLNTGVSATRKLVKGQWVNRLANDDDWFYRIDLEKTLEQFEKKFADGEAFKTASEICDLHLVPHGPGGNSQVEGTDAAMRKFWEDHALTGDNSRELPYSTIYPRLTTRSNTFRVHMRAQTIRFSGSRDPQTIQPGQLHVLSEYRGSTLLERYIDPADPRITDYAASGSPLQAPPLDSFYRVRIINSKRFDP